MNMYGMVVKLPIPTVLVLSEGNKIIFNQKIGWNDLKAQ